MRRAAIVSPLRTAVGTFGEVCDLYEPRILPRISSKRLCGKVVSIQS
ncbi:Uncharacterised protein [Mycobacteroides abscessus]|nr:Uncharacterised protein [Mycobacteroides abscessus]